LALQSYEIGFRRPKSIRKILKSHRRRDGFAKKGIWVDFKRDLFYVTLVDKHGEPLLFQPTLLVFSAVATEEIGKIRNLSIGCSWNRIDFRYQTWLKSQAALRKYASLGKLKIFFFSVGQGMSPFHQYRFLEMGTKCLLSILEDVWYEEQPDAEFIAEAGPKPRKPAEIEMISCP
jgi:hypothetical protein